MKLLSKVQNKFFILFLLVAAIPMTIIAGTFLIYNTTYLKTSTLENSKTTTKTTAASAQQFLNHAKEDIETVARSHTVVAGMKKRNFASLEEFIENIYQSHKFFIGTAIMDSEGYVRTIYPEEPSIVGNNWAYRKYFIEVMKTGKTYISDLVISEIKEHPETVVIAAPVMDENRNILGLALGHIDLSQLTNILKEIKTEKSGKIILVDRNGTVVSHPDAKMIARNIKKENNWVNRVLSGESGVSEGKKILAVYEPVPNIGWGLAMEESLKEALGIFSQTKWLILLIGLLSSLIVFVLSFLVGRRLSKPISQLHKGAELITQGNWGFNLKIRTGDEIEQLAKQFNHMAAKLKESYGSLEEKVGGRTKELEITNRQLSNAKIKLEAIFRQMGDGLLVVDESGRITEFNPTLERLTGWKAYEVKGRYCYEILKVEDQKKNGVCQNNCPLIKLIETNEPVTEMDMSILSRSGARIEASYNVAPLKDVEGELGGAVIAIQDMRKIKELDKLKDQFVAMVTHELRSPMTNIKGWASMLLEGAAGEINEEQKEFLQEIEQNNERLLNLVNDMLDISKIEQDRLALDIEPHDIPEIVGKIIDEMNMLANEKGLSLEFLKEEIPPVLADKDRVIQVLYNLIGNAIKFTDQGKITIWYEKDKNSIITHISDTGCGISPENIPLIFDKFFRAENQYSHKTQGTGLGLHISKLLVERMNGQIWVESIEGKGTTFSFSLPIALDFLKDKSSLQKTTTQL